ncbi:MAG: hypothetical protein ACRC16_24335, partial [Aeromonas salmonicida]
QIDQHQPGEVEQAPETAKQPTQTFENRHSRVIALLMGREGSLLTSWPVNCHFRVGPIMVRSPSLASGYACAPKKCPNICLKKHF